MSHALTLYRLQQTDTRIDQARTRLKAIHDILENDAELKAARNRLTQAEETLRTSERTLRESEAQVQAQQIKLEQAESSLYGGRIQNPKELQDLQNDVASLKRHLQTLEEHELEAMLAMDEARAALKSAETTLNETQGRLISQNASLKSEQDTLLRDTETLNAERGAITASVDATHLNLYNNIRSQRRGVAVALISDNACNACGISLTPGQAQAVRISSELSRCPSCGRILYSK